MAVEQDDGADRASNDTDVPIASLTFRTVRITHINRRFVIVDKNNWQERNIIL